MVVEGVNLSLLKEFYRKGFLKLIQKHEGKKLIYWDPELIPWFDTIVSSSILKSLGCVMMTFDPKSLVPPSGDHEHVMFITKSSIKNTDILADFILNEMRARSKKTYQLIAVPRHKLVCQRRLEEKNVDNKITSIDEFNFDIIAYDSDLLSLERPECYAECLLKRDSSGLHMLANAIMTLQAVYGVIPRISGKGTAARFVYDMIHRMSSEWSGSETMNFPQIDHLILLDRSVDPLTPLLTQLTYEGMIGEVFGIANSATELEIDGQMKKILLSSEEDLYSELRDQNFTQVPAIIIKRAKHLSAIESKYKSSDKTIGVMHEFVKQLPQIKSGKASLNVHTSIAELLKRHTSSDEFMDSLRCQQDFLYEMESDKVHPYIEKCILESYDLMEVLRLICIQSYCSGGLKPKLLEKYKREIIQSYGYQHLPTLENLEKVGLISTYSVKNYPIISKSLKLVQSGMAATGTHDLSQIYSGYTPLSIRLIQFLGERGWDAIEEVLNLLPGETIKSHANLSARDKSSSYSLADMARERYQPKERKVNLVVFIGGVTRAEVSALRYLSQMADFDNEYIILSTGIIDGRQWLTSLSENMRVAPLNPF